MFQQSYVLVDAKTGVEFDRGIALSADEWACFMVLWGNKVGGIDNDGTLYFYL